MRDFNLPSSHCDHSSFFIFLFRGERLFICRVREGGILEKRWVEKFHFLSFFQICFKKKRKRGLKCGESLLWKTSTQYKSDSRAVFIFFYFPNPPLISYLATYLHTCQAEWEGHNGPCWCRCAVVSHWVKRSDFKVGLCSMGHTGIISFLC